MVGIYKITSPSGRVYIGQSMDIEKRWRGYRNLSCKGQKILYQSFKKYGVENHVFTIVHELPNDVTQEILDVYEILYIEQYQSNLFKFPENNGMNLTEGGFRGTRGHKHSEETKEFFRQLKLGKKGRKITEETRLKMSISQSNRPITEQFRKSCSDRMKKETPLRLGKTNTKEHMLKQMRSKVGYDRVIEIYNKQTKILVDTCHLSPEAERLTGVSKGSIQNNLCGKSKSAGEYIFKYKILQ